MRKVFRFDAAFKNVHGCLGCDTCNKKAALLLSMAEDTVKIEEKEVGMSYSDVDFPTILRKRAHGQRTGSANRLGFGQSIKKRMLF